MYQIGDVVLASDVGLSTNGELVRLIAEKEIKPAGWCYQWSKAHGKPALWMPTDCIIRHATPEEVISFADKQVDIIQREIDKHKQAIEILESQLQRITSNG